ncbi:hypothetical protein C8T65DRAFT_238607 [Cerioporus squamosus]|nr:hypothetical protein C8T65DRAFT_238607 [Cerioporus squamosus]
MANAPSLKKNYYFFHATDVADSQRAKHMPEHAPRAASLVKNGTIVTAGALLPPGVHSSDAGALDKAIGSVLIVQADNEEHAWDIVKKDVFYASGEVWDHTKSTLTPIFPGAPQVE